MVIIIEKGKLFLICGCKNFGPPPPFIKNKVVLNVRDTQFWKENYLHAPDNAYLGRESMEMYTVDYH